MTCPTGNQSYPTREKAKMSCRRLKQAGHRDVPRMKPYFCSTCCRWHVRPDNSEKVVS